MVAYQNGCWSSGTSNTTYSPQSIQLEGVNTIKVAIRDPLSVLLSSVATKPGLLGSQLQGYVLSIYPSVQSQGVAVPSNASNAIFKDKLSSPKTASKD